MSAPMRDLRDIEDAERLVRDVVRRHVDHGDVTVVMYQDAHLALDALEHLLRALRNLA